MLKRKRYIPIIFFVFVLLPTAFYFSANYFRDKYKGVDEWFNLPFEHQCLSARLEIERIWYWAFTPDYDQQKYNHISSDTLLYTMKMGADWIVNMQEESGRYNYWYDPNNDSFSNKGDDNFLRQAGTGYSLMLTYETTGDSSYLESAKKNLKYLLQFKKELENDKSYFEFAYTAKLGGVALPLLTILKLRELTNDQTYDTLAFSLANMIIYLQEQYNNTGQYKSTYVFMGHYDYEKRSGWESNIYPGEAMLALANAYKVYKDQKYKESIDLAYSYYSKDGNWKSYPFLSWSISAFSLMYTLERDEKYKEFAYRMGDRMLYRQNLNSTLEVYGSFDGLPTVFASTSLEAMGDLILLSKVGGDIEKRKDLTERAKMGYAWIMKLQISDEEIDQKNWNLDGLGGFKTSLINSKIRIDNTQHAISALNKGYRYIYNDLN